MKKLKALVTIGLVLSLMFSMTAFAKEQPAADLAVAEKVGVDGEVVSPLQYNELVTYKSGTVSDGYGEVKLSLDSYLSSGTLEAAVAFSSTSGNVTCTVLSPGGSIYYLGTLSISTGATTPLKLIYGLQKGTYTFMFEATTADSFRVMCNIYK